MNVDVQIVQHALARFSPAVIYLFGSVAQDRVRPNSDIDLAFLPMHRCDPYEVFLASQDLANQFGREIDLIDLSQATAVMKAQVVGTGRRLVTLDAFRSDEFEMYALSDYARANEERREVLTAFPESLHAR